MTDGFTLLAMFKLGGICMWPLLAFSIVTITIIAERALYFAFHDLRVDDMHARLQKDIRAGELERAGEYLKSQSKRRMAAGSYMALVEHIPFGEHLMEKSVDAQAGESLRKLEKSLNFLVALAALSPLTGFLGTVSGMIGAFKAIAEATEVNAQIVANGIYEALITTVFGLVIAIVAVVGHNVLGQIVDTYTANLEKSATDLIVEALKRDHAAGTAGNE